MELCDVLDEDGNRTGKTLVRGMPLQSGEYHLSVQVWIRDEAGEYLIQQRAMHLVSGPGMWATTAGYVLAGEDSVTGAIREVREELGIDLSADQLTRFDRLKTAIRIEDVWIASVIKGAMGLPILGEEVTNWTWASKAEIYQMIREGLFFAYSYFDQLPE